MPNVMGFLIVGYRKLCYEYQKLSSIFALQS